MSTAEQKKAFFIAQQSGAIRDIALAKGGTGEQRKPLSAKEKSRRRKRRKMVKLSRKANR